MCDCSQQEPSLLLDHELIWRLCQALVLQLVWELCFVMSSFV